MSDTQFLFYGVLVPIMLMAFLIIWVQKGKRE